MMRVTHRMVVNRVIANVQRNVGRLEDLQQKIGSGKRIGRPADDPVATALGMRLRAQKEQNDQYQRNIESGRLWMQISESALNDLTAVLKRARELAVQAANDVANAEDRQAIAQEVDALMEHVGQLANSSVDVDQHVFGGFQTVGTITPFVKANDAYTYQGDSGAVERQIGPNSRIQANTPGNVSFTPAFDALQKLRDGLNAAGASAQTVAPLIDNVDTALTAVLATRTELGARLNQLDHAQQRIEALQVDVAKALADQEDLDFADALTQLALQEAAYRASLQSGSRAIVPSLLDFLR